MVILQGIFGMLVFLLIAFLLSENRRAISIKVTVLGVCIQIVLAVLLSKVTIFIDIFNAINNCVLALNDATTQGTEFVFGFIGGGQAPFAILPGQSTFNLAFQALPLVIVISALSAILFHLRILPIVIRGVSWVVSKSLGLGGALAMAVSANLFIGMAESPLVIRPYLRQLTRSELFTLMTCGMAGVAGTVMALYVMILGPIIPEVMKHVIAAVLINVPAVVVISRMIVPETYSVTAGSEMYVEKSFGIVDALIKGVKVGGEVFISIVAILLTLVALVAFVDKGLHLLPQINGHYISLEYILGYVFAPFVWVMGVPWVDAHTAGQLMATRMVLNELVSYGDLAALPAGSLDPRSQVMMLYAMCGFANFSGLGIMLAAYNVLIPERRKEFLSLGFKSLLAGTLCSMMTATIVGVIYVV